MQQVANKLCKWINKILNNLIKIIKKIIYLNAAVRGQVYLLPISSQKKVNIKKRKQLF